MKRPESMKYCNDCPQRYVCKQPVQSGPCPRNAVNADWEAWLPGEEEIDKLLKYTIIDSDRSVKIRLNQKQIGAIAKAIHARLKGEGK